MAAHELERRAVHAAGAGVPALYLLELVAWPELRAIYLAGSLLALALESLRLVVGFESGPLARVFEELTREYERGNPAGYALYTWGSAGAVWLFASPIAVPAVLILTLVDPTSGLLAENEFGEPKRPLVLGVVFALSALIAAPFVPPVAAALGALAATVADGLTPVVAGYVIDDNVTIPLGSASAMWVGTLL